MFFTRCKFYPHKYNSIVITIPIVYGFFLSIVITIPIVDGFFFYFSTFKFPSYFSQIIVDLNILSINSGYQAEFNPRPLPVFLLLPLPAPSAGLYLPSPRILCFGIPQTVTWLIPSKSVTKFGRPKAMMHVTSRRNAC